MKSKPQDQNNESYNLTEIKREEIAEQIKDVFDELIEVFSRLKHEEINTIPFEESWTAGQLARHLIKSGLGFAELLNGSVEETRRDPHQNIEGIKTSFLDYNIKMTSPDFIVPEMIDHEKEELLRTLITIKQDLIKAIQSLDLLKTCISFELPVIGYLTRLEAIYFVIYHSQRHLHQLKNICHKLGVIKQSK